MFLLLDRTCGLGIELPANWPYWKTQIERVAFMLEQARKISRRAGVDRLKYITTGQWYEIGLPRFSSTFSRLRAKGYVIESERIYKDGRATGSWRSWLVWKPGDPGLMPARQFKIFN